MTNPMLYGAASPMTKDERERQQKLAALAGSSLEFPSPTPEEIEAMTSNEKPFMTVPLNPGTTHLDLYVKGTGGGASGGGNSPQKYLILEINGEKVLVGGGGASPGATSPEITEGVCIPTKTPVTQEPSAEEIEAAARAICVYFGINPDNLGPEFGPGADIISGWVLHKGEAEAALKAAMVVRSGK